jgi:hypothetical protein
MVFNATFNNISVISTYICDLGVMVADSERKYDVTANCHVTPFKLKRDNSYSNL